MRISRRLSRHLLSASIRGMIVPRRRGSLLRKLLVTAAVLGPMIYLGGRGRASLRLVGTKAPEEDLGHGLEWQ